MIIYKAINKITEKIYIGQTIQNFEKRKGYHLHSAIKRNSSYYFHRSIRKYGWKNFEWGILEECYNEKELGEKESYYIKKFKSKAPNGYNMTDGNDNTTRGYKFTEEQKKKLSLRSRGKNNPNYGKGDKIRGDNNPAKRKSVRKKISRSAKGRKRPDVVNRFAKYYIIKDLETGKEQEIYNMAKWIRKNSDFTYQGVKCVLRGEWKQYKGFHFRRLL